MPVAPPPAVTLWLKGSQFGRRPIGTHQKTGKANCCKRLSVQGEWVPVGCRSTLWRREGEWDRARDVARRHARQRHRDEDRQRQPGRPATTLKCSGGGWHGR